MGSSLLSVSCGGGKVVSQEIKITDNFLVQKSRIVGTDIESTVFRKRILD